MAKWRIVKGVACGVSVEEMVSGSHQHPLIFTAFQRRSPAPTALGSVAAAAAASAGVKRRLSQAKPPSRQRKLGGGASAALFRHQALPIWRQRRGGIAAWRHGWHLAIGE